MLDLKWPSNFNLDGLALRHPCVWWDGGGASQQLAAISYVRRNLFMVPVLNS